MREVAAGRVRLATVAREWGRIGVTGFGGPPAHIALFRKLCVDDRQWLSSRDFNDVVAATNLLPGPASTQLAIYCAWRLRGRTGALVGGVCFIAPGLAAILALSALFLSSDAPRWVVGAAAGFGAAVPVVAVSAAAGLLPGSWRRAARGRPSGTRWVLYVGLGVLAAATVGPYLVAVLAACGLAEAALRPGRRFGERSRLVMLPTLAAPAAAAGGLGALAWVAFKVGALSYGGGFVIVPLMQHDVVSGYHWMSGGQFLNAVALGQITPGPVVQTVAAVGFAAAGLGGGLLAAFIAFAPSFLFVLVGGRQLDRLRRSNAAGAFLAGAGAAAIGAIAGAAIPLARALSNAWQFGVLVLAGLCLIARRSVVVALLMAGALGVVAALAGAPLPR